MPNTSLLRKVLFVLGPFAIVIALVAGMASTATVALAGKGLANGMKCKFSSDCDSGNCSFNVCKAKSGSHGKALGNGASCKFSSDCESRNCSFNVCKAKSGSSGKQLGNGASCKFSSDCESRNCSFGVCKKR